MDFHFVGKKDESGHCQQCEVMSEETGLALMGHV